jgi:hypothetical protein
MPQPDNLDTIIEKVRAAFVDVTPDEIAEAITRSRGPVDDGLIGRHVTVDGRRVFVTADPRSSQLGEIDRGDAERIRRFVDGVEAKKKHLRKQDESRADLLFHLRNAIEKLGRNARPDAIIAEAHVARQAGRNGLRELEALCEYDGFSHERPSRYTR